MIIDRQRRPGTDGPDGQRRPGTDGPDGQRSDSIADSNVEEEMNRQPRVVGTASRSRFN